MSTPMRRGVPGCCASAASGHAVAAPLRSVMNSRRLMGYLSPRDHTLPHHCRNTALCITAKLIVEWQRWVKIGHCGDVRCMTALPPKAEVHPRCCYVAEVTSRLMQRSKHRGFIRAVRQREVKTSLEL